MSILQGANGLYIEHFGATLVVQGETQGETQIKLGSGIEILLEASSPGATMESTDHYDRRCFPETRNQFITDIVHWATAPENPSPKIYWMSGPAGVGKSSIAQTCAEKLKASGNLGAAFFFSIKKYDDHTRLFTTLAYLLSAVYPEYGQALNTKICGDRTLVRNKLRWQFQSLIVEPLQELEQQSRAIQRRVIFIDGLDECADIGAQMEIIEVIASSVNAGTTPFRWAIFSRSEPHLTSTFDSPLVSPHTHRVFLPISRQADTEIELYLRGGFANILRRKNLLHLASTWPSDNDIKGLVDAAAGFFAHPATVLRFIDSQSYIGLRESLESVLSPIKHRISQSDPLCQPYKELDQLYYLILEQLPEDILPHMLLLFSYLVRTSFVGEKGHRIAIICNALGISETIFRGIYHHMQAVIAVQEPMTSAFIETIDLTGSFYDQDPSLKSNDSVQRLLYNIHGAVVFRHKSFYDFLIDPLRSSHFCVTAIGIRTILFDRLVAQHEHYASGYVIEGTRLVSSYSVTCSTRSLSWPHGTNFVDSFLQFEAFRNISIYLSCDHPRFDQFLEQVPATSLQKLSELDFRKNLIAIVMDQPEFILTKDNLVAGFTRSGLGRVIGASEFMCIGEDQHGDRNQGFQPTKFLDRVEKLRKAGVMRPYHPWLGSGWATSIIDIGRRPKTHGCVHTGRYEVGLSPRSTIYYWEFDTKRRYFHGFQTVNYKEAYAIYRSERFEDVGGFVGGATGQSTRSFSAS
ncbi:hypothetical protein NP233_g12361 [Leucocoprinus birnbaumii]|uniref:Nephrocystin 3-like N-terminal domain-containing protein n=1 Tax=Leucocoprinus birnbaumii TaxID=56174 RepID=A0AAD5VF86_9AGAR|nr:hypothetical protein NP233_g12361 [Leucocoprinus birnbaumii]